MGATIELRGVSKRYGDRLAVENLTLTVAGGELLVIVGESGCGKTTALKMINRLVEPTAGAVLLDGQDVSLLAPHELRRRIGYVFQRVGLFPHMTVAENVGITPSLLGWQPGRIRQRVDELLSLVELDPDEVRERMPADLSGGQQQRVGVARALAAGATIVLLDEPFGALDPLTRRRLHDAFDAVRRRLAVTSILVSHDMSEALLLADRIAVMRAGRLVQIGTPCELLRRPADDYVRGLLETPTHESRRIAEMIGAAT
ncbi:MAG TPA: ATP-binding cassette domain-containing protein [Candidatus Limnocylindrales bacterium]|nr:ATP-binding cassette domain-containing protein [Candidatus Limnocylindrales bacterium]